MIDALLHTFVSLVLIVTLIASKPEYEHTCPWNNQLPRWMRSLIAIAFFVNTIIGVGSWLHVAGVV